MAEHTMQAAVWHAAGDVRIESVKRPLEVDDHEAIVAVDVATICASDLAEYRDGPHVIPTARPHRLTGATAPLTLGHEFVGRVVAVGREVTNVSLGDRVTADACIRCGECYWCERGEYNICERGGSIGLHVDGAFAERVRVPAYTLHRVPDAVSDLAAAIVEPLAVGLHALRQGRLTVGESVVIVGFGMVGAAATLLAVASGASRVIVVEGAPTRAELARRAGASDVLPPGSDLRRAVRALTNGRGADLVIDCTGRADVLPESIELSRRGGRTVVGGISHEPSAMTGDRIVYFEREIIGSLGYRNDHATVIDLLASGRLDVEWLFAPAIGLEKIVEAGLESMKNSGAASWLRIPVAIRGE